MKWYNSVKVKVVGFFLMLCFIFIVATIVTFSFLRETYTKDIAKREFTLSTFPILNYIENTQLKAEEVTDTLRSVSENNLNEILNNNDIIQSILCTNISNGLNISSGGIWLEKDIARKMGAKNFIFFNKNINNKFDNIKDYIPTFYTMDFYTLAKKSKPNEIAWTQAYTDPITKIRMVTLVSPLYIDKKFIGAASIDLDIDDIKNETIELQKNKNIYMIILDKNRKIIGKTTSNQEEQDIDINYFTKEIRSSLNSHSVKDNDYKITNKTYFLKKDPILHTESILTVYDFSYSQWRVLIGKPKKLLMSHSNKIYTEAISIIIILTILSAILGYILLKKTFVIPIEKINRQLYENSHDKTRHYTMLKCDDHGEIGELVNNLNNRTLALMNSEKREKDELRQRLEKDKMLVQQSKMAAMGEMMDAVAHQWKQPLNALSMYSDIIESDFKDDIVDEAYISQYKADMQIQINHMVNTLDEFRSFFRPNKEDLTFTLCEVIESVLILIKDDLLKNKINIKKEIGCNIQVVGSANEFKHLLINIINNARDAFNENHTEKRTITMRFVEENFIKSMEIEDNAGGIPETVIDSIFNANVTTKAEGKGTGIGLYMSKQIAEKHHASLSVRNVENGACFRVSFNACALKDTLIKD